MQRELTTCLLNFLRGDEIEKILLIQGEKMLEKSKQRLDGG